MNRLLFITNGHGEDIVAAEIIKNIRAANLSIDVLPVVGRGDVFEKLKVNIIGPRKALPGGGFGLRNFSYLIKDVFSGLIWKIASQIKLLRQSRGKYSLVVGIGDIVPIFYSMLTGSRFIFIGVNKSSYYKKLAFNYISLEKQLLKKNCLLTLVRDEKTAKDLKAYGIKIKFAGNPMMDMVQNIRRSGHRNIRGNKTIGFLPGTRDDAYKNIEDFNKVAWQIKRMDGRIALLMSLPDSLDRKRISRIKLMRKISVTSDFNRVLSSSDIIIGLSGTANEQAAGLGIPVISFPGRGAQYNFKFAKGQKELLGNALLLLPRQSDKIAAAALSLLHNRKLMGQMGSTGVQRMGKPGASAKMAGIIERMLNG